MMWDAIVIGSGFGGAMAAHALLHQGHRVLMVERGGWVARGPENWGNSGAAFVTPHFSWDSPFRVNGGWRKTKSGAVFCVGGQSVFYGGASFRFRERDFEPNTHIVGNSGAEWPFRYAELEPAYTIAEILLGVSGATGADPTEPHRSTKFPHAAEPLAPSARKIASAAARLGLHPSRIPMAIAFEARANRAPCMRCGTCDGYACAAEAKNDIATSLIPKLIAAGMTLRTNTVCVRLLRTGGRITGVAYVDRVTGQHGTFEGRAIVLAAGTLATPHLLLTSNLAEVNPAGDTVGRYLTRHNNSVVFGVFSRAPNPNRLFDKQIVINDFYDGVADGNAPAGPLGSLQQMTPPLGIVRATIPRVLGSAAALFLSRASGLLAMAEDQPQFENGVHLDRSVHDRFGLPRLEVHHRYSARDRLANKALSARAGNIMREAGAFWTWTHTVKTFSHALGTVRMGVDEQTSPLDGDGRYRGLDNLYVVDGSALPRSAALNPSLTIAANALRIGARLAQSLPAARQRRHNLPAHA